MLNILVPLAGKNTFKINKNNAYPKILHDIDGKLLLERAAEPYVKLQHSKKIIIATPKDEVLGFGFDKVLGLIDDSVEVCHINNENKGAVCSALLAIEYLNENQPLIITSFEQVLNIDISKYVDEFLESDVDAGVLTFEAIHPKWSYVKTRNGFVTQAAEKLPISKQAIAGFYYFKTAKLFIEAAKDMIRKDVTYNGLFYISHTLNEIILKDGKVLALPIDKAEYFHIHDEHSLESYEESVVAQNKFNLEKIRQLTKQYVDSFNCKDIKAVANFFSPEFELLDPAGVFIGKNNVAEYIDKIFTSTKELRFSEKQILVEDKKSVIEFELCIDDKKLIGTDVIEWNDSNQMVSMKAYLFEV